MLEIHFQAGLKPSALCKAAKCLNKWRFQFPSVSGQELKSNNRIPWCASSSINQCQNSMERLEGLLKKSLIIMNLYSCTYG
jgi:hypothetical protein